MARKLKLTKDEALMLLNVTDLIPRDKVDVEKHLGFRSAIKKEVKDFLEKKSDLMAKFEDCKIESFKAQKAVTDKLNGNCTEEEKPVLQKQLDDLTQNLQNESNALGVSIYELAKPLKKASCEVTFDNEDFNSMKLIIKDNAKEIFKTKEGLDADFAEKVFDLLNQAE